MSVVFEISGPYTGPYTGPNTGPYTGPYTGFRGNYGLINEN